MEARSKETETFQITKAGLLKFLIPSLFGIIIFLLPVKDGETFNIPLGVITEYFIDLSESVLPLILMLVILISTLFSVIAYLFKPAFITDSKTLNSLFNISTFWLVIRVIGAICIVMTYYNVGMEVVIAEGTGGVMLGLLTTLIVWFLVASFLMPYLINFGIMEFTGTLLRGVIKP